MTHFIDAGFATFAAVSGVMMVTPGLDTALVTRKALRSGGRAATFTALGGWIGSLVWAAAWAGAIGLLLEQSVTAFTLWRLRAASACR